MVADENFFSIAPLVPVKVFEDGHKLAESRDSTPKYILWNAGRPICPIAEIINFIRIQDAADKNNKKRIHVAYTKIQTAINIHTVRNSEKYCTFDDDIKTHDRYYEYLWVNRSIGKSLSIVSEIKNT